MNGPTVMAVIALVAEAEPGIWRDDAAALAQVDDALDAIREALRWAVAQDDKTLALRLAGPLWRYWHRRALLAEGQSWLAQALDGSTTVDPAVRAKALDGAGVMAMDLAQYDAARAFHAASLTLARQLDDPLLVAGNLESLGVIALALKDYDRATAALRECLVIRHAVGAPDAIISTWLNLAAVAVFQQDVAAAQAALDQAIALDPQVASEALRTSILGSRAMVAFQRRDYGQAATLGRDLLRRSTPAEPRTLVISLEGLAATAVETGQGAHAALLYGAAERIYQATGIPVETTSLPQRPDWIAQGQQQAGNALWAAAWTRGNQMDYAALVAFVEAHPW